MGVCEFPTQVHINAGGPREAEERVGEWGKVNNTDSPHVVHTDVGTDPAKYRSSTSEESKIPK